MGHLKYWVAACLVSTIAIAGLCAFIIINNSSAMASKALSAGDPSSYSRPEIAAVTGIHLNLDVNFEKKTFNGYVTLNVMKIDEKATQIILDSKALKISKIVDNKTQTELVWKVDETNGEFGAKLTVQLPTNSKESVIKVIYETDPEASGLQWLAPSQTAGKQHPYVFSQFQAIHARSFLPCQDTPSVKTKYTATITAPSSLTVLMSAIPTNKTTENHSTIYNFEQKIPIPTYLIAIAIGNLESRKLGPRSHVWAEPELVDASAAEFSETERQLQTAESICGPYVWGIYDLLVLPPSFAFGGMENPCLTFVTPTLLAGDKSLANVVAHEIAHSWTGNLITNRNFEHFWLNEGFTVFVERKIKGRLTSGELLDFDALKGADELREAIKLMGESNPLTSLVVNLKGGVHPDDAFSTVPYEKGHNFLRILEGLVGGPKVMEQFLRDYFNEFKYKSIETEDFVKFFKAYFKNEPKIEVIDWNEWLNKPGMPPQIPNYDRSIANRCEAIIKEFVAWNGTNELPNQIESLTTLTSEELIYVLQKLVEVDSISIEKLQALDQLANFSTVKNAEIKFRWLRCGLKAKWREVVQPTLDWLNEVGRMKYVRPLYRDLYAWADVRQTAIDNFNAHKKSMMHVVAYTVAQDLHLN